MSIPSLSARRNARATPGIAVEVVASDEPRVAPRLRKCQREQDVNGMVATPLLVVKLDFRDLNARDELRKLRSM